jgi:integrase
MPLSVSTHHFLLILAKGGGKWAQKEGLLSVNPFADVSPLGKRRAGKMQLRIDEAHQLSHVALELAAEGDSAALGVLLMLHLGLRQGEVGARVARDVDAGGKILWVPTGKTKNAVRRLKVPEFLQDPLLRLASQKQPAGLLFTDGTTPPKRQYFWQKVRRLCTRAQVPLVCPHSLRGLHATLALEAGATSTMVAHALGHGSFAMTAKHYASPKSVQGARTARVAEALALGDDAISRVLADLTPAQLAALKARLK